MNYMSKNDHLIVYFIDILFSLKIKLNCSQLSGHGVLAEPIRTHMLVQS